MKPNHRRCSGIDVHKNSVTVCVLAPVGERHIETKKRKFRIFTRDLKQLRACLKHCQVTEIAMESFCITRRQSQRRNSPSHKRIVLKKFANVPGVLE